MVKKKNRGAGATEPRQRLSGGRSAHAGWTSITKVRCSACGTKVPDGEKKCQVRGCGGMAAHDDVVKM